MNRRIASPRPTRVAGDLGEHHLEPHPRPDRVRRAGLLGGGLDEPAGLAVAAAVGEGVGLVDEVDGDAPPGQPAGQRRMVGGAAARQLGGLGVAADAQQAHRPGRRQLDLGPRVAGHDDRVEDLQRVGGPTGVRQQHGPASLERAELLGIAHQRPVPASSAASAPSRSRRDEKRVPANRRLSDAALRRR